MGKESLNRSGWVSLVLLLAPRTYHENVQYSLMRTENSLASSVYYFTSL
jgi:hypothetical protein